MDSTKPASRRTRRCFDTVGCGIPSRRSISPTDCCDETSRLNIARRFGSAMISNTDSMLCIYSTTHIRVKVYLGSPGNGFSGDAGMQSGRAESSVQPQQWMECRRHRTAPDSDEIPRRRRTGLVRDNQTDLDCGLVGPVSDPAPSRMAHWREIVNTCGSACHAT